MLLELIIITLSLVIYHLADQRMDSSLASSSDWTGLPKHLFDLILEKLNLFSDYVRFSCVCVPWYSVAMENRKHFAKKIDRQLPMLLFPKKDEEKGEVKILYNVSTKKLTKIEVRVPFSTRYGCSSKGWLFTMDENFVPTLINPMSPGAVITLPPILTDKVDYTVCIEKAILSADPLMEPNDYTVAIIYGDQRQLAFIQPGRQNVCWTFIDKAKTVVEDIIYHQGRLHAIDYVSVAFTFDDKIIMASSMPRKLLPIPESSYTYDTRKSYLVESLGGELLLVRRFIILFYKNRIRTPFRYTLDFDVFKWDSRGPKWVKMESLGAESLFLGDNMSTSVLASEFPGFSPNSIYFSHDHIDRFGDRPRELDYGVFNLDNSSFASLYEKDQTSLVAKFKQLPIWFAPNFLTKEPFPIRAHSCMIRKRKRDTIQETETENAVKKLDGNGKHEIFL